MPNTTNYSFPTPADTDLVKNGADAIRDLGDAVDTAMNTALGTKKAGMVLLNTTSFSGVTSVSSAAATFSSTYTDYYLKIDLTTAGSNEVFLRLRAAGVDATGSNYKYEFNRAAQSGVAGATATTTSAVVCPGAETNNQTIQLEIFSPFIAGPTTLYSRFFSVDYPRVGVTGVYHNLSTSYDAFTILCASNITGTYSVYGFAK